MKGRITCVIKSPKGRCGSIKTVPSASPLLASFILLASEQPITQLEKRKTVSETLISLYNSQQSKLGQICTNFCVNPNKIQGTAAKQGGPQKLTGVLLAEEGGNGSWGDNQDPFFSAHLVQYGHHIAQAVLSLTVEKQRAVLL